MTKKEKELIKKAIKLIHSNNEYYEGMDILAKLVGYKEVGPIFDSLELKNAIEFIKEKEVDGYQTDKEKRESFPIDNF